MIALPRLVAFDLDDTLAPSKTALDPRMAKLFVELLELVPVCVISGGQFGQFESQLLNNLHGASLKALYQLHLMPTCGTQYYLHDGRDAWELVYSQDLTYLEKGQALAALENSARDLGLWESETWGPILEDRGSQITFSALGQDAPVAAKLAWDPTGEKKAALQAAAKKLLPLLEVRSGGSTSVDVTREGIDKAYGMIELEMRTKIPLDQVLFVGDRLDEGGNDYPVKALGVECFPVTGWEDTASLLEMLIPKLRAAQ